LSTVQSPALDPKTNGFNLFERLILLDYAYAKPTFQTGSQASSCR
jgi:hypothetical protein